MAEWKNNTPRMAMMRSQSKYACREDDIGCIDNCLLQTYLTGRF
jgi:hypothetical protein